MTHSMPKLSSLVFFFFCVCDDGKKVFNRRSRFNTWSIIIDVKVYFYLKEKNSRDIMHTKGLTIEVKLQVLDLKKK